MKNAFRLLLSLTLLSTALVAQLPSTARCQMSLGGIFASRCTMGCCKKQMPLKGCPMVKAESPNDLISLSAPALDATTLTLQTSHTLVLLPVNATIAFLFEMMHTLQVRMAGPPPPMRAPPADSSLINA